MAIEVKGAGDSAFQVDVSLQKFVSVQASLNNPSPPNAIASLNRLIKVAFAVNSIFLSGQVGRGTAISKAAVSRSPSANGSVACHMVDGKIASMPDFGATWR